MLIVVIGIVIAMVTRIVALMATLIDVVVISSA